MLISLARFGPMYLLNLFVIVDLSDTNLFSIMKYSGNSGFTRTLFSNYFLVDHIPFMLFLYLSKIV